MFFITGYTKFDVHVESQSVKKFGIGLIPKKVGLCQLPILRVDNKADGKPVINCDDQYEIFVNY